MEPVGDEVRAAGPCGRLHGLHTFSTGIRAVAAPLVGFLVIAHIALSSVALMAAGLMIASSMILLPEARAERAARAELADVTR